jgi:hypothetical protein
MSWSKYKNNILLLKNQLLAHTKHIRYTNMILHPTYFNEHHHQEVTPKTHSLKPNEVIIYASIQVKMTYHNYCLL